MIRIFLVDDQKTIVESLKAVLKSIPDFEVVGTADNGQLAIAKVSQLYPDVILVDMEMPGLDGIATTQRICAQYTGVRVIILSMHDEDNYVAKAVRAGAMGYLIKNTPARELEEAIRSVHRGYAQIGPGLLNKIITVSAEPVADTSDRDYGDSKLGSLNTPLFRSNPTSFSRRRQSFYLSIWLLGNIFIWTASLLYLKFASPTYTSSWTIALPGTASSTSVDLPEIGRASSQNQSPFSNIASDPRENYRLLVNSDSIINSAAAKLGMTPKEFGKPKVAIVDNSTSIELAMEGDSPQEAKTKAIAIQQAFQTQLNRLKNIQSTEPDPNTLKTIDNARQRLERAREKLALFRESSGLNSNAQLENTANSIEQMRIEKAQLSTQQERARGKSNQLLAELNLSPTEVRDALALYSDQLFEQYLDSYSQAKTQLIALEAKYLTSHPAVITQQENIRVAEAALLQRASSVLGQTVNLEQLQQLQLSGDGNSEDSQLENIIGNLIDLQGEQQGLQQQAAELDRQMTQLENAQKQRSRSGSELDRLEKNVQIAEAVYSSTLSQLEINLTDTSDLYPPISVLTPPNLPREPSSPKTIFILLGSGLGSFFLTTALLTLYCRERRDRQLLYLNNSNNTNHYQTLANGSAKDFEVDLRP